MQGPTGANVSNSLARVYLQLAGGHVVDAREAEHVSRGLPLGDVRRVRADHHAHLCLVIDPAGAGRNHDRLARPDHRGRGLEENHRLGGQRLVLLGGVVLVVQAHRDDLRRRHRREQPLPLRRDRVAGLMPAEDIPFHQPPLAAVGDDVTGLAFVLDPVVALHRAVAS
jgi:hypothetical protein